MIQQIDIDHVRELGSDQPVPVSEMQVGDVFSFARYIPSNYYKIIKMKKDGTECVGIAGANKNLIFSFPLEVTAWLWRFQDGTSGSKD